MYQQERQLQLLRQRFLNWLPYLQTATMATVRISPSGQGNGFFLIASWAPDKEYKKVYDVATVLRQGRVRCVKDYARAFIQEVLKERGVL
jgi:hypothetical protein